MKDHGYRALPNPATHPDGIELKLMMVGWGGNVQKKVHLC